MDELTEIWSHDTDPRVIEGYIGDRWERLTYYVDQGRLDSGDSETSTSAICLPDDEHPANVIGSLCTDGMHRPVLDIDFPARLIPSSTPGHFHLYLDLPDGIDPSKYQAFLQALGDAGVLQFGFVDASNERGQTDVRLPHVLKPGSQRDVTPQLSPPVMEYFDAVNNSVNRVPEQHRYRYVVDI